MKKNWIAQRQEGEAAGRINGTGGDDHFVGSHDSDVYHGRGGNDLIDGNRGDDRLVGGTGHDDIYGERGKDKLYGGPGYDFLIGGQGEDKMTGGSDADVFRFIAWPSYGGVSHLDVVMDFDPNELGEYISINIQPELGITKFSQLRDMMVQDDNDVVLSFGGVDTLVLKNVRIGQLSAEDFYIEPRQESDFH